MKKINLIIILLIGLWGYAFTQNDIYYTRNANLEVHGKFNGENLHGSTKQLGISLDYETSEITLKLKINNIEFDVDSLNKILVNNQSEIEFRGVLSLEYINTNSHPPQNFNVEGWGGVNDEKKRIKGTGELYHIDQSGNLACMLGMTIKLNLHDHNVNIPRLENEVEIVVQQVLLKKGKN